MAWLIWAVASLFYLFEVMLRVSPSVMTQELMQSFQVTSTQLGLLTSSYYYTYVALQLPCGLIVDTLGPRRVISTSCFISALGILLFAYAETFSMALFARTLIGAGASCGFISCLKVILQWFPRGKFSRMCALTNNMGTLGGLLSGYPLALSVSHMGWNGTCQLLGVVGLCIVVLSIVFVRDNDGSGDNFKTFLGYLGRTLREKYFWIIGIVSGLMYLSINTFAELWAVPYLKESLNIDTKLASSINVLIFVGAAIGAVLSTMLAERWKSYVRVLRLSCIAQIAVFLAMHFFFPIPLFLMIGMFIMIGLSVSAQILCFSCVNDFVQSNDSGTRIGFCNMLTSVTGLIFQPFLGFILDWFWEGTQLLGGARLYSAEAYNKAIVVFPVCSLIALILLCFVKKSYRRYESL